MGTVCQAIDFDGLNRTFRLYTPGPDAPRPLALVFFLHGAFGTGIEMALMTQGGLHDLAKRDGAIVVYPDAVDGHWNDGRRRSTWYYWWGGRRRRPNNHGCA